MKTPKPDRNREPRLRISSLTTRIGLVIVLVGWIGLLAGPVVQPIVQGALHVGWLRPDAIDLARLSENLIVSGFGLAILGAVQSGFHALNAFFEAVLRRSVAPKPAERPKPEPAPAPPPQPPKPDPNRIVERGRLKGRPYTAFADGTIEVETLLGPRRFVSIEEARDFVGS